MLIYLIPPVLMIVCIIHVIKTGRSTIWIWVLIFLQGIGPIAYFLAEILPDLLRSRGSRALAAGAVQTLDPGRAIRQRQTALEVSDTIENRRLLAEEYSRGGKFDDAVQLYETTLVGMHADDPALLVGLARAASAKGDAARALAALDHLKAADPDYQSTESQLIRARSLEALGREDEALGEYEQLAAYAPGEEARCRRALLLLKHGRETEAKQVFGEILRRTRHADGRYRRHEREWIDIARRYVSA